MRSVFFLLDSAPYGSEKAFGFLNAAAVSSKMDVAVGLLGTASTFPWSVRTAGL